MKTSGVPPLPRPVRQEQGIGRLSALLFFPVGVVVGLAATANTFTPHHPAGHFVRQGGYRLIQPLLDYEVAQHVEQATLRVKQQVQAVISAKLQGNHSAHVSVYFRDLSNGPWFGIQERELFIPGSLMKIPILIAYLTQAETDPTLLTRRVAYSGGVPLPAQHLKPSKVIEEGAFYLIEDLLARMIVYSDNKATAALVGAMDKTVLARTFTDLGITKPNDHEADYAVSVKAYATFFRILFNASYLSRQMSEQALDWLTQVEFRRGLVAGVPRGVTVAHKFGERALGTTKQFHDCGIVYCPRSPYLLCVMSRSSDFEGLVRTTEEISRLVYQEICTNR